MYLILLCQPCLFPTFHGLQTTHYVKEIPDSSAAFLRDAEEGMHVNLLVVETQLPYGDVSSELMMLELQGLVRALPGGIYRLVQ